MSIRTRWVRASIAALTLIGSTACASVLNEDPDYLPRVATLTVQNKGWEDVTLYVVRGSMAIRIGQVSGLSSRTILIPTALAGNGLGVQIEGRLRHGYHQFTTQVFDLWPGANAKLTVEQLPSLSNIMFR